MKKIIFPIFAILLMFSFFASSIFVNPASAESEPEREGTQYLVPMLITEERMDELIERFIKAGYNEENIKLRLGSYYAFYGRIEDAQDDRSKEIIEVFNERYPGCRGKNVYMLNAHITLSELERLEENYFKKIGLTYEEIAEMHRETGYISSGSASGDPEGSASATETAGTQTASLSPGSSATPSDPPSTVNGTGPDNTVMWLVIISAVALAVIALTFIIIKKRGK